MTKRVPNGARYFFLPFACTSAAHSIYFCLFKIRYNRYKVIGMDIKTVNEKMKSRYGYTDEDVKEIISEYESKNELPALISLIKTICELERGGKVI